MRAILKDATFLSDLGKNNRVILGLDFATQALAEQQGFPTSSVDCEVGVGGQEADIGCDGPSF